MSRAASRVASRFLVVTLATLLATGWLTSGAKPVVAAGSGTVSLATIGVAATQNFDTLANSGTANTTLPTGWFLHEAGTSGNNNDAYNTGTGSSNAGDTYSFGAAANTERAFGGLLSGTLTPTVGGAFTNNTGLTIGRLDIAYTGEGWRLGADPTTGTPVRGSDRLDFQYSLNATALNNGDWVNVDSLDFTSPLTGSAGARAGNDVGNKTALSASINGLSIAAGATFWLRWSDFNVASSDDGLAVDDFSITPMQVDAAPAVSTTSPADNAENVAVDANVVINFSEPVTATGSWYDITCGDTGNHTASVTGGPQSYTLDPDADFNQLESCTVTVDAADVVDNDSTDPPDSMAANYVFDFQVGPECDDTYTPIYDIQGDGAAIAITGSVYTEGVVVGDFEGPTSGGLQGFYIQDAAGDGDAATSDGIFVYTGNNIYDEGGETIDVGDLVRVKGTARDRFPTASTGNPGMTAITNGGDTDAVPESSIWLCGTGGSVAPTPVTLPWASQGAQEQYEGMLVTLPQTLVIAEYFNLEQFGEIVISLPYNDEDRPMTPTTIEEPGSPGYFARLQANLLSRITLDDGLAVSNPSSVRHPNGNPFSLANKFRGGDHVADVVGVLSYDFSRYGIEPTSPADYAPQNPRPESAPDPGGNVRVSAMNTLNFFITADYPTGNSLDNKCGPSNNVECRGWDFVETNEFTRQRTKLLQALMGINADVLGLNELENSTGVDPLAGPNGIVPGLNSLMGANTYAAINTGTIGTDAIKVGLIYKPAKVTPVGTFKVLTSAIDPRFIDTRSRPALAQTFLENATGARFTVVVNHLKSKGSSCADIGDPIADDGQGNCNLTRKKAAQALVDWLATDPTGSGDPDFLIMGDLNSYAMEDPIDAIKAGADDTAGTADDYTNLIADYQGAYAYSYTFDGQAGYLDHALANASAAAQVTGAEDWHINSDEPDLLDYDTSFKPLPIEAIYEPNQFRTSDHDPILVGLDVVNFEPTIDAVAATSCGVNAGGAYAVTINDVDLLETELSFTLSGNTNTTLVPNGNVVVGGAGANRTISITAATNQSGTAVLTFTLSDGYNTVDLTITVKVGNATDNVLVGTAGVDLLIGLGGEDTLTGLGDVDILCAGKGDDSLDGGGGNDLLEGGIGEDSLVGGDGNDVLRGSGGEDYLTGSAGADSFSGGAGADVIADFSAGDGDTSDGT